MVAKHASSHKPAVASQGTAPPVAETPPANLPIPPEPITRDEEAVRKRAYQLWESAGCPEGDGMAYWLEAERELHGR